MEFAEGINRSIGTAGNFMAAVFGQYWFLFAGFFIFNIIDLITGWYCSKINKSKCPSIGTRDIIKKIGYWIVIGVAFYIAYIFKSMGKIIGVDLSFSVGVGWIVLAWYLINEIKSVLDNAVRLGWAAPKFLLKIVRKADNAIDENEGTENDESD